MNTKFGNNSGTLTLIASGLLVAACVVGGASWLVWPSDEPYDPNCNSIEARRGLAHELRQLADVQEQCGYLEHTHDRSVCSFLAPPSALERIDSCEDVQDRTSSIRLSLQAFERNVRKDCEAIDACRELLSHQARNQVVLPDYLR